MRKCPRRTRFFAAILALPLAGNAAAATDLLISEYIEGSSNNKAVEIYNGTDAEVNLGTGQYVLQVYANGGTSPSSTITLTGSIAAGDVYVIANSSAVAAVTGVADLTTGSLSHNGDDALVLRRGGSAGTVVDSFGRVGEDPGTEWGTGAHGTADATLRRKATVCAGDTVIDDAFDPSTQWDAYANDTFAGLGSHTASCVPSTDPTDPSGVGAASPSSLLAGDSTLLTVAVTGGTNPDSSAITVVADLSAIGGDAAQAFFDDGSHGDAVAADGTWSYLATVGGAPGQKTLPVAITDGESREGTAEIALSVIGEVTIAQIQGLGVGSPLPVGTEIVTEGIVTARRSNGYFIQSARGEEDSDPMTAEGVFVFTSTTPPADAAIGNRVRVAARVAEYRRTPHGFPLTQLGNSSLTVIATGQKLPATVTIDTALMQPGADPAALGRYQGMRVKLPQMRVVGPTNSFGDFHVVPNAVTSPFREPGIAVLDDIALPPGNEIPLFDKNAERLRIESTGLVDGSHLDVDNRTRLKGLRGVMYYDRGDFTLLMGDHAGVEVIGGALPAAVPAPGPGQVRIGSYNIENLSGGAAVPLDRLAKLNEVFCRYMYTPDVVGLVEIADLATAQRLAESINDDEFGFCPDSPDYEAHVLAGSGAQRLGFLVRRAASPGGAEHRVEVLSIQQEFVTERLVAPDNSTSDILFDRPPLHLVARIHGDNGNTWDAHVIVNHNLSLLDVNDNASRAVWGTTGARSRGKRAQQAVKVSELVESIHQAEPDMPVILIGDFNAFEFSDGYVDVMGIISGTPAAENTVLVHADSAVTVPLTNLLGTKPEAQRYSFVFEGNLQALDHAVVNQALLESTEARLHHARVNADFAEDNAADTTVPLRSSDHDPLVAELLVPAFLDTDLTVVVEAKSPSARLPNTATLRAFVANAGAMPAAGTTATLALDVEPEQILRIGAPGWTCDAPIADPVGTVIACRRGGAMDAGVIDRLTIDVQPLDPGTITLSADVQTRSNDTDPGNNQDAAGINIVPAR
ncbi:lamin tail domain-containing protein [Arenimonas composti]|uniref:LTD domain-containing protein n=1 Tax=Arenimonas composti TR7-09 = DSM 18010 TaxID=1121013 RepID=A0A091BHH2_9GAMM|nr:lamin tail domain-containing protein [Arenimonas composti]KFN50239.1 hypothetical protein P873_07730 [Arenimonas composti TR7-09 = DSM 18010]